MLAKTGSTQDRLGSRTPGTPTGIESHRVADLIPPFLATTAPKQKKRARLWKAVSIPKLSNKKRLGLCNIRTVSISTALFDLLDAHLLTLLLIGGFIPAHATTIMAI
jgi:hypothetical protein